MKKEKKMDPSSIFFSFIYPWIYFKYLIIERHSLRNWEDFLSLPNGQDKRQRKNVCIELYISLLFFFILLMNLFFFFSFRIEESKKTKKSDKDN